MPVKRPARPTSSQDPPGRTALPSRSMDSSETNSAIQSCSQQYKRLNSWPIAGDGSTTPSGCTRRPPALIWPGPIKGRTTAPDACAQVTTPAADHKSIEGHTLALLRLIHQQSASLRARQAADLDWIINPVSLQNQWSTLEECAESCSASRCHAGFDTVEQVQLPTGLTNRDQARVAGKSIKKWADPVTQVIWS